MGPDTQSGRPSPRGGGPAYDLAVQHAKELIAEVESVRGPVMTEEWIGRATVVLQELTRDA